MGRWTTIKVPVELRDRIKALSERLKKPQWRVLVDSIGFFEAVYRHPRLKEELSDLDKVSWYITKLAVSFGAFKENPSDSNLEYLKERVEELGKRLGVDAGVLLKIAEYYKRTVDQNERRKIRAEMNAAFKQVLKELLSELMVRGEQRAQ